MKETAKIKLMIALIALSMIHQIRIDGKEGVPLFVAWMSMTCLVIVHIWGFWSWILGKGNDNAK